MAGDEAPFFTEFLDEFFAECDEHLIAVRRALLALDGAAGQAPDPQALDQLLRSFHTMKGLAGMVGVQPVEQLAHQLEDYLRALRQGQAALGAAGLRALGGGASAIEQQLRAYQQGGRAPDIAPLLTQVAALLPSQAAARPAAPAAPPPAGVPRPPAPGAEQARLEALIQQGAALWRVSFVPTAELTARGVNVNSVRARLQGLGEVVRVTPHMEGPGKLRFEFLLAGADPASLAEPAGEGLAYEPFGPPTPAPQQPRALGRALASASLVRVDLKRIDEVIDVVGELVISRSRLREQLQPLEAELPAASWRPLQETMHALERQLRDLRQGVMQMRLVPVGETFTRMQFAVRDLADDLGKAIAVELQGQETEIDKFIVERMLEPLLHLVRNAASHGLEDPAGRAAAGKPAQGTIALRAAATGDSVTIVVEDDGRGIDAERVAARARALGLLDGDAPADGAALLDLICAPGFSTREEADRVSGRGIGMDVVARTVHELGGALSLWSEPGRGTRFTIALPLTLAIVDALIVGAAGQIFAMPMPAVREIVEVAPGAITALERNELIIYREGALPLVRLARRLGLGGRDGDRLYALVVGGGQEAVGLVVERIVGKREIVVRALADPLLQVDGLAGATELGDGRPIFILDAASLARAPRPAESPRTRGPRPRPSEQPMAEPHLEREQFVLFELAGATYALPSRLVRHMEMVEQLTPVPSAPPFVAGVVLSRGQVLPAIDLRARFGFEPIPYTLRTRLIVVDAGERRVGLIVDTAREFVAIAPEAVQPPPEGIAGLSGGYLRGIANLGERLALLIDLDEVLSGIETIAPADGAEAA
jgi:two-component system chemotaxis sensor kinase CheA